MHSIAVTTECVADIPRELLDRYGIDIIYYDVKTDAGLFRDGEEIYAENIVEYMIGGEKKAQSVVPSANNYKSFFQKKLDEYDEVIHICIASKTSESIKNARLGIAKMGMKGRKIYLVDSQQLSTGQGLLALAAAGLRNEGMAREQIIAGVERMIPRVCSSFITNNADYLYYNGRVSRNVMKLCRALHLHPVLLVRDGRLVLQTLYFGNYKKAAANYMKRIIKKASHKKVEMGFVTYVGCRHEMIEWIKETLRQNMKIEELWEQKASATISCNSGPLTFGIFWLQTEET